MERQREVRRVGEGREEGGREGGEGFQKVRRHKEGKERREGGSEGGEGEKGGRERGKTRRKERGWR